MLVTVIPAAAAAVRSMLSWPTATFAMILSCGPADAITPASMARARAAGLEVAGWTVRRAPTFDRLGRLGVVACCVEAAALGPRPLEPAT